jgi:hypothetical protein
MNDKLKSIKLNLLLKELKLLDTEKEYVEEFTTYYTPIFLNILAENGYVTPESPDNIQRSPIKNEPIEVDDEDQKLIKSIFRSIAKLAHPDKSKNAYRNLLYEEAQDAYDKNNLLVLYKIAKKLNIEVEINTKTISLLQKIIKDKKKEIENIECSFLWMWANESDEDKRKELINRFIEKHGK